LVVAVLACPIGMGLMTVLMMRGGRRSSNYEQIAELRSEVERLKAERTQLHDPLRPVGRH
jgi:hypothetical protein